MKTIRQRLEELICCHYFNRNNLETIKLPSGELVVWTCERCGKNVKRLTWVNPND